MSIGCTTQQTVSQEGDKEETKKEMKQDMVKGGYVEQAIEFVGGINGGFTFQRENGNVGSYEQTKTGIQICELNASNEWEKDKSIPEIKTPEDFQALNVYELDGKINIIYLTDKNEIVIGEVQADGSLKQLMLKEDSKPVIWEYSRFSKRSNGDVFLSKGTQGLLDIFCYDGKTGELKKTYKEQVYDFVVKGNAIYTLSKEGIIGRDIDTDKEIERVDKLPVENGAPMGIGRILSGKQEGEWYLAKQEGLFHLNPKGSIWEQLVSSDKTTFANKKVFPQYLFMQGDSLIVHFFAQDSALRRYYYDENAVSVNKNKITIYMLNDNNFIRAVAQEYQKQHEDIKIEFQVASELIDDKEPIKTLNTALLAGEGPDIMVLDYLPIKTYIDKGILLDMSDIKEEISGAGGWYENIVDAFKKDGKYYALPGRFGIPMLWGKEAVINQASTLEELAQYKKAHPEEILFGMTKPELFMQFATISLPSCMAEDGRLDIEKLRSVLESIDTLSEEEYDKSLQEHYCFNNDIWASNKKGEILDMTYKETDLTWVKSMSETEILTLISALRQRGDGSVGVLKQGGKVSFDAQSILGINTNSKNQEIAKEIVKLALSEKGQSIEGGVGYPINKKVMLAQKEGALANKGIDISDNQGRRVEQKITEDERYKKVEKCLESADLCASLYQDDFYYKISTLCMGYCSGEMTMEEVLGQIEKVADLQ